MSRDKTRKDEHKAIQHLMTYIDNNTEWSSRMGLFMDQMIGPIAEQLDWPSDEVTSLLMNGPYSSMAFGYIIDEFVGTRWDNEPDSLIETYLKHRGWRESPAGRQYLTKLNKADANLYEVMHVNPEGLLTLKPYDNPTKQIEVVDHAASESLKRWDLVAGRILKLRGRNEFAGGLLMLPPDQARSVANVTDQVADEITSLLEEAISSGEIVLSDSELSKEVSDQVSMGLPEMLFRVWGVYICHTVTSDIPQLRNTDGDSLELVTVRFKVTGSTKKIRKVLDDIPTFETLSNTEWLSMAIGSRSDPPTVLGDIELSNTSLELHAYSKERAAEIRLLLETALTGLVDTPLTLHESLDSVLSHHQPDHHIENDISPEDMQDISKALMYDHYRKTLDEPIPMLGDKSPRECAADPILQNRVIEWLKYLENSSEKQDAGYDFNWMWKELSLSRDE